MLNACKRQPNVAYHEAALESDIEDAVLQQPAARRFSVRGMLQSAMGALKLPIVHNAFDDLPTAMGDWATLNDIKHNLFAACTELAGKYSILMLCQTDNARRITQDLAPSYWLDAPPTTAHLPHVHILEQTIGSLRNWHMITFKNDPTDAQLNAAKYQLWSRLDSRDCKVLCTKAFRHQAQQPFFEADGSVSKRMVEKVLSPLAKKALSARSRGNSHRDVTVAVVPADREPINLMIWARQSLDEKTARTSISRQVWSTLTSKAPPLMSLHPDDRIIVVVEYCSSFAHPWEDRLVQEQLPLDRPIVILTSNPNRVTRRAEEADFIFEQLAGETGSWWSRGAAFDGVAQDEWFEVAEHFDAVEKQIEIGQSPFLASSMDADHQ